MIFRNRIPPPSRLFSRRNIQVDAFQDFFAELIVAEEICPAELPKAAGSYVAGTAIGGMLGRIISGFLSHLVGWDMTITILDCIGAVGTVLAGSGGDFRFPGSRGHHPGFDFAPHQAAVRLRVLKFAKTG